MGGGGTITDIKVQSYKHPQSALFYIMHKIILLTLIIYLWTLMQTNVDSLFELLDSW